MTTTPIPADPESFAALHEQDARALRVLLLNLAALGGEMAGLYVQQAKEQAYAAKPGAGPSLDCATAYNGVTRSVRRMVMLIQKLTAPAPVAKAVGPDPVRMRKQIIRRVEDAIHCDAPEGEAESLRAEFLERLEGAEFDDELGQRPVQEIVNEIRADLGIHGPGSLDQFKRRTPEDIAVLYARAAPRRGGAGRKLVVAGLADHPSARPEDNEATVAPVLQGVPPIRGP